MTSHAPAAAPSSRRARENRRARWAAWACSLGGFAVFQFFGNANRGYIDTASLFYWWGFQWANPRSETEHGWLILALSAGLLWWNLRSAERGVRITARESETRNSKFEMSALAALLAGLALHGLGFVAQQARVSILALLIFLWGVLRLGGGQRWGGAAMFPVAFLVFAIPINALDSIGLWLRMWVVDASAAIAHAVGIGVLQSGTLLVAPDGRYNYDVAAACSGVRSLTAMVALSLLAGYLHFQSWPRRTFVLLLCFPLVYAGNVARILAIVFAAHLGGSRWGERAHDLMGFGVFAIVLGGVLGGMTLLQRWWPERPARGELRTPAATEDVRENFSPAVPIFVATIVLGLAVGEMFFLRYIASLPPLGRIGVALATDGVNPIDLPAFVGTEWAGRREPVTTVEREILPPDTGYSRKLYASLGRPAPAVFLSIVLSGRDRTSIHRPELCLLGQGWTVVEQRTHRFTFPAPAAPNVSAATAFPATALRVQREVRTAGGKQIVPQLVVYWFVGGDTIVATHWQRLALDAWNRVAHARADRWAYVLLQTDAADGDAAALARMQAVLDGTLPAFQKVRTGSVDPTG